MKLPTTLQSIELDNADHAHAFQLTELEERLEMVAINDSEMYVCCNCLPDSYCV